MQAKALLVPQEKLIIKLSEEWPPIRPTIDWLPDGGAQQMSLKSHIPYLCQRVDSLIQTLSLMTLSSLRPPGFIAPQVPILVAEAPKGEGWIHEIKHDGLRTLLRLDRGNIRALARDGRDWSDKYHQLIEASGKLRCQSALIDGEVVVRNENGASDFAALRDAIDDGTPHQLTMLAFDLLFLDGKDLRDCPIEQRQAKLRWLIRPDPGSPLQFIDQFDGDGIAFFQKACMLGLEGIVSKRVLSPYRSGPSKFWLTTRNMVESELILVGIDTDGEEKSLAYLAREAAGELKFAGTASLALTFAARHQLAEWITLLVTDHPPLSQCVWRSPRWLRPELRVRVRHLAGGDPLRHASIQGLLASLELPHAVKTVNRPVLA